MKKIIPHLWYDKEAKEAAEFYTSLIPNSKITNITTIRNTPSGDCDIVSFELAGQPFMSISAGPLFKFNPSISFHIKCKTIEEVDEMWAKLSREGKILMKLGKYPFSEKYGWLQDKYGVSWQIIYVGDIPMTQRITPVLMYMGAVVGKAEEAANFYTSVFKTEKPNVLARYPEGGPDKEGTVAYESFKLFDTEMGAMDSAQDHKFSFNEAISLLIPCENQQEIDYFWEKLSASPEDEQCGWLKDKYGVSWQVWSTKIGKMIQEGTPEQVDRVVQTFLPMKKFDIAALEKAFKGE